MTRGRTSRSSPAAIAAAEAQKNREDDLRIKNLLDDYTCIVEEKVPVRLCTIEILKYRGILPTIIPEIFAIKRHLLFFIH